MGLLDGVVFSGGEPLAQGGLVTAIGEVRAMGFKAALHTAGPVPGRLTEVLPSLSWVGFDMKAPWSAYPSVTGAADSGEVARASLNLLIDSGVPFEVRTTIHPDLLDADALYLMAEQLSVMGVSRWVMQRFRTQGSSMGAPALALDMQSVIRRVSQRLSDPVVR